MFARLLHYIQYHNATTGLFIVALFFGVGTAFAASDPELRQAAADALVSEKQTVTQTDNSVLLSLNVDTFDPRLKINDVVEDEENYYASYTFTTLTLEDGVWQETRKTDTLTVNKQVLAERDLGLYLADELGEITRGERAYLAEVQADERKKGATRKKVAVDYTGLIGRFLDSEELEFDGYKPVVKEPEPHAVATEEDTETTYRDETSDETSTLDEQIVPEEEKEQTEESARESTQEAPHPKEGDVTPAVPGESDVSNEEPQEQKADNALQKQSDTTAVEPPEVASEQQPNKPEEKPQPEEIKEAAQPEPQSEIAQPAPQEQLQEQKVEEAATQPQTDQAAGDQNQ